MGMIPTNRNDNFQFASSTCVTRYSTSSVGYNPPTDFSSSSEISIYGSISAGEAITIFVLIGIFILITMNSLARALSAIKTKKRFLQYNGGDVEIRDDY